MSLEQFYRSCGIPKGVPRRIVKARKLRMAKAQLTPIRAAVVERAESCCERCRHWVGDYGHAHHRIPRSLGGTWTLENIEYVCAGCHAEAHRTGQL